MSDKAPKASFYQALRKLLTTPIGSGETGMRQLTTLSLPDLTQGPLIRVTAFGLAMNLMILLLTAIATDGGGGFACARAGSAAHFAGIAFIFLRRAKSPTQGDRNFLLAGSFLGMWLAMFSAILFSSLFWSMRWHGLLRLLMRINSALAI